MNLSLLNDSANYPALLSGLEVYAANPLGVPDPTVDLDLSADGGATWTAMATGLSMNSLGQGSYAWTIPTTLAQGNQYLVRVTSDNGLQAQGQSGQPFLITNNGTAFYVNDSSTGGGVYTTAPGNDANSGKSPNAPLASLQALLTAYTFQAGDIVYVDTGTYNLLNNLVLGPQDSGVTIEGPTGGGSSPATAGAPLVARTRCNCPGQRM